MTVLPNQGLVALVVNSKAGSAEDTSGELQRLLKEAGLAVQCYPTDGGDPAIAARKALGSGATLVVAAGGDGTVSAVASALVDTNAVLGVIPAGTLNHFAKDLGIPVDAAEAAHVIVSGVVVSVDVGEVNERVFVNNSSLGIYPRFAMFKEGHRRSGKGRLTALVSATIAAIRRIPFLLVRVKAEDIEIERVTPLMFFGNNLYDPATGLRERLDKGRLCVHIVNAKTGAQLIGLFFRSLIRLQGREEIETFSVTEAVVETRGSKVRVSTDGEVTEMRSPLRYRIRPASLRVMVPPESVPSEL